MLNVETEDHYRTASKVLNEAKFTWSSYENKQTTSIRVIIKMIHQSYTPDQKVHDLRQKKYNIINSVNILKWKTKETLPLFMPTFDRT
jgi:tRNA splicing ligase